MPLPESVTWIATAPRRRRESGRPPAPVRTGAQGAAPVRWVRPESAAYERLNRQGAKHQRGRLTRRLAPRHRGPDRRRNGVAHARQGGALTRGGPVWPQGDDRQRVGGLGRRRAALLVPAAPAQAPGRDPHLGRPGRHLGVPPTIDGGGIIAPSLAFYDLSGKWAVENGRSRRTSRSSYAPADVLKGHDHQLERAVQEAMKLLGQRPPRRGPRPPPIKRVR